MLESMDGRGEVEACREDMGVEKLESCGFEIGWEDNRRCLVLAKIVECVQ